MTQSDRLHRTLRSYLIAGVAIVGAGLVVVPPMGPSMSDTQARAVRLASVDTADTPLGAGTALVIGPSSIPIPSPTYVDTADSLYLQPLRFTGTTQPLFTPAGLQPITGVKTLPYDTSVAQGQQILDSAIHSQINAGGVDAANPVVVFGWSQSSTISSLTMPQLHAEGVPSDDVHFVLLGDPNAPNGGVLERFDVPINGASLSFPSLGMTFSGATPADLYPTDIYTIEYDGFADFPQYTDNLISDLNAVFGLILAHEAYFGLTPEQLLPKADGGEAIPLPTSVADTLTDYYMIPNPELPLLQPLQLLPVIGQPLYDLLEPDTRILVNLGYGNITDGWSQGDADVPTTFGLFPTNLNLTDVLAALGNGLVTGITDAVTQLENPDNYQPIPLEDNPALTTLLASAKGAGIDLGALTGDTTTTTTPPSFTDLVNDFSGGLSNAYATLLPDADTLNALLTTLPADAISFIAEQAAAGNLLGGIDQAIAAATGLIPFTIAIGMLSPLVGLLGI